MGATHYYAELQGGYKYDYKNVELKNTLTPKQAAKLNKPEVQFGLRPWKAGDLHRGFDSREDAIAAGVTRWMAHFPKASFLVLGKSSHINPKPILATTLGSVMNNDVTRKGQEIVGECESLGWYDNPRNDDKMDELCKQWESLLSSARKGVIP